MLTLCLPVHVGSFSYIFNISYAAEVLLHFSELSYQVILKKNEFAQNSIIKIIVCSLQFDML